MPPKAKKPPEPAAPSVPAYIVTFSDMVTLLLTFFVMLLSLAQVRDKEMFNKSRDAFVDHINCYGLGLLMGKQMVPELGQKKVKYHIPDPDEDQSARTLDSKDEALRRLFNKVAESMQTMPSRVDVRLSDFVPVDVRFSPGQTALDDKARQSLTALFEQYRFETSKIGIYILGLAPDEANPKQQWRLSASRAQQVAEFLGQAGFECPIYAWGAGSGAGWIDQESPIPPQSQIAIAFVRDN